MLAPADTRRPRWLRSAGRPHDPSEAALGTRPLTDEPAVRARQLAPVRLDAADMPQALRRVIDALSPAGRSGGAPPRSPHEASWPAGPTARPRRSGRRRSCLRAVEPSRDRAFVVPDSSSGRRARGRRLLRPPAPSGATVVDGADRGRPRVGRDGRGPARPADRRRALVKPSRTTWSRSGLIALTARGWGLARAIAEDIGSADRRLTLRRSVEPEDAQAVLEAVAEGDGRLQLALLVGPQQPAREQGPGGSRPRRRGWRRSPPPSRPTRGSTSSCRGSPADRTRAADRSRSREHAARGCRGRRAGSSCATAAAPRRSVGTPPTRERPSAAGGEPLGARDDQPEQDVVRVRVAPVRAGCEQRRLSDAPSYELQRPPRLQRISQKLQVEREIDVVAQAAGVVQQLPRGDRGSVGHQTRQPPLHVVVKPQAPLGDELQDPVARSSS
jgi:hypothetical protein